MDAGILSETIKKSDWVFELVSNSDLDL